MDRIWVLVADRARARLFEIAGRNGALTEIEGWMNPDGRASIREMVRDQRARIFDRVGEGRHGNEPRTDPKDKSIDRFARELQERLERGRVEHRFERLVVVAPPAFLGALNGSFGKPLRDRVAASIDKDLTRLHPDEIRQHLVSQLHH